MSQRVTPASPIFFIIVSLLLAGPMSGAAASEELFSRSPERGGVGLQFLLSPPPVLEAAVPLRDDVHKLDERLSLIVTDKATTSAIKFSEVMDKLVEDMRKQGHDKIDKLKLFRTWWDTANTAPGMNPDNVKTQFCNSESDVTPEGSRRSTKNDFPYNCPRKEGNQAKQDPFTDEASEEGYTAIAFINRFDLADKTRGVHCGEYRIVFARNSGFEKPDSRNLIIFEALVPNPSGPPPVAQPI